MDEQTSYIRKKGMDWRLVPCDLLTTNEREESSNIIKNTLSL